MIHRGMTDEEYQALPGTRASWLKVLARQTPAHLQARMQEPVDTEALRVGRALHTAVLEPELYDQRYAVAPQVDRRTKEGRAAWEEFTTRCEAQGQTALTHIDAAMVNGMARGIARTSTATLLRECDMREVVLTGEVDGYPCKARIDACNSTSGLLVDVKTCQSASPRAFTRSVVDFGYLLQMAFYRRLMLVNGIGSWDSPTVLVAVEKQRPYCAAMYHLHHADLVREEATLPRLLELLTRCQAEDTWPGYSSTVQTLLMPEWAFTTQEVNDGE